MATIQDDHEIMGRLGRFEMGRCCVCQRPVYAADSFVRLVRPVRIRHIKCKRETGQ